MINLKFIVKSIKTFNKLSLIYKLFIILLILVFFIIIVNKFNTNNENFITEGFEGDNILNNKNIFEIKRDQDIYDSFYSKYYDSIFLNKTKNNFEIGEILNLEKNNNNTKILDVGCGTGNHVSLLTKKKLNVIGIDQSEDMIEKANLNYPNCEFVVGNILKNDFDYNTFSHILCLGRTIYEIKNKEQFFETCYSLLNDNGLLIINLSDYNNFKPYVSEKKNKDILFDSSNYGKTPTSMIVKFSKDIEFMTNFEKNETKNNKNIPNVTFKEKFENFKTNSIRKNELNLYINPIEDIISLAKSSGFSFKKKIFMKKINYNSDYLYVFKKS